MNRITSQRRAWRRVPANVSFALLASGFVLGQEVLFEIQGQQLGEFLCIVHSVGDLDQDGHADVLVSSTPAETMSLYSGATHALILEIVGEQATNLGGSADDAGDFDGDGWVDIVAGASSDSPNGVSLGGSARVYSGHDGHEIARWNGSIASGYLGLWAAGLGDVDGDGYADVATCGLFDEVFVLGGPDMHLIRVHHGELTRPSVAGLGDVNGDGRPDYVCGWPQDSTQGLWTGRATVFSGRTGAEIFSVYGQTPQVGGETGDHLGLAVADAGDVDADGIPDFAVGAPGEIDLTFGSTHGMVRVYSGADASIIWEWQAIEHTSGPHTKIGFRLSGGGDINGDGHDDLVVTAPHDLLVQGPGTKTGSMLVFSGRTGKLLWRTFDLTPGSFSVTNRFSALLGDVDGDGLADFALGNPDFNLPAQFAGHVLVYAGASGDIDRLCPPAANSTGVGARLETHGPIGMRNNYLTLGATGAVPGEPALLVYGPGSAPKPFGDGTLCLGRPFFRLSPPLLVGPDGSVEHLLNFTTRPLAGGPGGVQAGTTAVFQLWYADPASPGAGFNLSDALRITFLP